MLQCSFLLTLSVGFTLKFHEFTIRAWTSWINNFENFKEFSGIFTSLQGNLKLLKLLKSWIYESFKELYCSASKFIIHQHKTARISVSVMSLSWIVKSSPQTSFPLAFQKFSSIWFPCYFHSDIITELPHISCRQRTKKILRHSSFSRILLPLYRFDIFRLFSRWHLSLYMCIRDLREVRDWIVTSVYTGWESKSVGKKNSHT